MERMQSEQGSDQAGTPGGTRHRSPDQEDEDGIESMPEDVLPVHRAGAQPEELAIDHVRQRGEGMPIAGMGGREGPNERGGPEALVDHRLVLNIGVIIQIHETAATNREVSHRNKDKQHE